MKKKSKRDTRLNLNLKQALEEKSNETLTHVECLRKGVCQETEGFKGTRWEGVDVCEDGCVWFKPKKK